MLNHSIVLNLTVQKRNTIKAIWEIKVTFFIRTLPAQALKKEQQITADIGGIIGKSVTKSTDYLVVG